MKDLLDGLLPDEPGSAHHRLICWLLALPDGADPAQAAQALLDRPTPPDEPPGFLALLRQVAQCRDLGALAPPRAGMRGFLRSTAQGTSPCRPSPARRKA